MAQSFGGLDVALAHVVGVAERPPVDTSTPDWWVEKDGEEEEEDD